MLAGIGQLREGALQRLFSAFEVCLGQHGLVTVFVETVPVDEVRSGKFLAALVLLAAQRHDCALAIDADAVLADAGLFTGDDVVVGLGIEPQQQLTFLDHIAFLHRDARHPGEDLGGQVDLDLEGEQPGGEDAGTHRLQGGGRDLDGRTAPSAWTLERERHDDGECDESGGEPFARDVHGSGQQRFGGLKPEHQGVRERSDADRSAPSTAAPEFPAKGCQTDGPEKQEAE